MILKCIEINPFDNLSKIIEYFEYPFVRNALIVSVLVGICAAILGVFLILKRYSALGDGLSHVAFGAAAVAATAGIFDLGFTLPVTVLSAVLILRTRGRRRIMGDAAIAMLSVGALAVGYTVMSIGGGESNLGGDVCTALFGSSKILSVSNGEVGIIAVCAVLLIALTVAFYYKLLSVTFDEDFSFATGTRVNAYNTAIAVVCAIVIVIGMKIAGALLISALIVFPALSAMRFCRSFGATLICSGVIASLGAVIGVIVSIILETPLGATVAATDILIYAISQLIRRK